MARKSVRKGAAAPNLPSVEKVELPNKHLHLRIIGAVLLVVLAAVFIGRAVAGVFANPGGWTTIEPKVSADSNGSLELMLQYELGRDGNNPAVEQKRIAKLYTDACTEAYRLFSGTKEFPEEHNIWYLSQHPNEMVTVDAPLYEAFSMLEQYQSRYLYFAPIYEQYRGLFSCVSDIEAEDVDPYVNADADAFVQKTLSYVQNPTQISLELLGENQVRLNVSDDYLRFAKENEITEFLDFFWLQNAFTVDYVAQSLMDAGFTHGVIASYDGFSRHLGDVSIPLSVNLFDWSEGQRRVAARMPHPNGVNLVTMRSHPVQELDVMHYYTWENGAVRTPYIDETDGKCKAALSSLTGYSSEYGCAEIALQIYDAYAADQPAEAVLQAAVDQGTDIVFCQQETVYHSAPELSLTGLYDVDGTVYRQELWQE